MPIHLSKDTKLALPVVFSVEELNPASGPYSLADDLIVCEGDPGRILVQGESIYLRKVHADLMSMFGANQDCIVPKDVIVSHVWGARSYYSSYDNTLRTTFSQLRRQLGSEVLSHPDKGFLHAVRGVGYVAISSLHNQIVYPQD